jgi:predicted ATP-dependent endonuclease of OLD family
MKIKEIKIQNYKTAKNLRLNMFEDITLIVGKNNIGKSNTIKSLEIFFDYIKGTKREIVKDEDFIKKTSSITIELSFNKIKEARDKIKEQLENEINLSRPNRERLSHLENTYQILNLSSKRNNELTTTIVIRRSEAAICEFSTSLSEDSRQFSHFKAIMRKKHYADHIFKDSLETKKSMSVDDWCKYDWLEIESIENENNNFTVKIGSKSFTVKNDDEKIAYSDIKHVENFIKEYINEKQKLFYIPAYRGGRSERDFAVNQLFDLMIDDLVHSKRGVTNEYDTITDAIWGTGKNTNKYNINSVIEDRVKKITEGLVNDSISSIHGIRFNPYEKSELRRSILKMMIGSPKIMLDDGVESDFESKGTGIQSSFMITLMKSLSKMDFSDDVNIILAVEEPEAFAHPQLVREIISNIMRETSNNLFQFIVTTHSSVVVNYVDFNKIQRLHFENRMTKNVTNIKDKTLTDDDWRMINRIGDLSISEVVFSDFVLFVEGEGDKIVLEKTFRAFFPEWANRISVISLSGNTQIFRISEMLDYYGVKWLMVVDKDSFINKKSEENEIKNEADLNEFFTRNQIGQEYKDHYRAVLSNQNVSSIKVSSGSIGSTGRGEFLKKMKDKFNIEESIIATLFKIINEKIDNEIFPLEDAIEITKRMNEKMKQEEIPFHCMTSDLEGMIVNEKTLEIIESICGKYFQEAFSKLLSETVNCTRSEKMHLIRKFIGSKTHKIDKITNGPGERKKPHIPIEIISEFLEKTDSNYTKEQLVNDFPDLTVLTERISSQIKSAH